MRSLIPKGLVWRPELQAKGRGHSTKLCLYIRSGLMFLGSLDFLVIYRKGSLTCLVMPRASYFRSMHLVMPPVLYFRSTRLVLYFRSTHLVMPWALYFRRMRQVQHVEGALAPSNHCLISLELGSGVGLGLSTTLGLALLSLLYWS